MNQKKKKKVKKDRRRPISLPTVCEWSEMKKRRKREGGSRIKWKVEIKKWENRDIWVYMCGGEKTREKKTYGWNKGKE